MDYSTGGYLFQQWLGPAVPTAIGIAMILTAVVKNITEKRPIPIAAPE